MTVQNTPSFVEYVADGIQTSFNFTFRADDVSWVLVDYLVNFDTITLNLDQDATPGGSVSYTVPPPNLEPIRIERLVPSNQNLNYTRYDPFDSESHEGALDKLTMILQDHVTLIGVVETTLTANLDQEILDRIAGDATLQSNLDAETAARIGGDNTEIALRIAGDAAVTAAYIAADNVVIANQLITDNLQDGQIFSNFTAITSGVSPGHQHVLADIIDYIPPVGTIPAGTAEGQTLYWDNGGGQWVNNDDMRWIAATNSLTLTNGTGRMIDFAGIGPGGLIMQVTPTGSTNYTFYRLLDNSGSFWFDLRHDYSLSSANHRLNWRNQSGGQFLEFDNSGELRFAGSESIEQFYIDFTGVVAVRNGATLYIEQATVNGNITGHGQLYVEASDDSLHYVTEAGVDTNLLAGGGGVAPGTVTNATLRWSGAAWVEITNIRHRFSGSTFLEVEGSGAFLYLQTTGAAVDEKRTYIKMDNFAGFAIQAVSDGGFNGPFLMGANRTGTAWQALQIQTQVDVFGPLTLDITPDAGGIGLFMTNQGAGTEIFGITATGGGGIDFDFINVSTVNFNSGGVYDFSNEAIRSVSGIYLQERAAALGDISNQGQFWVLSADGNRPMFTDGDGNNFFLAVAGGSAGDNVSVNNSHDFNTLGNFAANFIYNGDDGGADTITLEDSTSTVNWPLYTAINLICPGSNTCTIVEGSGTTLFDDAGIDTVGGVVLSQGVITIYRSATGSYIVWGSGYT